MTMDSGDLLPSWFDGALFLPRSRIRDTAYSMNDSHCHPSSVVDRGSRVERGTMDGHTENIAFSMWATTTRKTPDGSAHSIDHAACGDSAPMVVGLARQFSNGAAAGRCTANETDGQPIGYRGGRGSGEPRLVPGLTHMCVCVCPEQKNGE